jgi:hypothetical protein
MSVFDPDQIYVIDDFLPQSYVDQIEIITQEAIYWKYVSNIAIGYETPSEGRCDGYSCHWKDQEIHDRFFAYCMPLFEIGYDKIGLRINGFEQMRFFSHYPSDKNTILNDIHVDLNEYHMVGLYYVNDSDGDTVIFDKSKFSSQSEFFSVNDNLPVKQRVSPKKGRLVIFDGRWFHASTPPRNNIRTILNANVRV